MKFFARINLIVVALGAAALCSATANAATQPADPCSLLSPAQVGSALGETFKAPVKTVAPRPFMNTVQGTDCQYSGKVLFRIYYDPSVAASTDLFARLKLWFGQGSTATSGIGDEGYFDKEGALHVRKGNVRFYIEAGSGKQVALTALGRTVVGEL